MLIGEYHVETDGVTVWVHSSQGFTVARFGRMGIDIHNDLKDQEQGKPKCLMCSHSPTTSKDWDNFIIHMKQFYGVTIDHKYKPKRFGKVKGKCPS